MTSIITQLRDLVPIRPLTTIEALRVAELQASRFHEVIGLTEPPFPDAAITGLPRVQVERLMGAPMAGAAQWSLGRWLIVLNGSDPATRQRFSLAHEFKHLLDNPFIDVLYPATHYLTSHDRAEHICDFFAGCLLMPRAGLKRAWTRQPDPRRLAEQFDVSPQAMRVRLTQVGLLDRTPRCALAEVA
jgi:Zn-dependent peptidase ImmA (M78 family)